MEVKSKPHHITQSMLSITKMQRNFILNNNKFPLHFCVKSRNAYHAPEFNMTGTLTLNSLVVQCATMP